MPTPETYTHLKYLTSSETPQTPDTPETPGMPDAHIDSTQTCDIYVIYTYLVCVNAYTHTHTHT